uniref:Uncharacterized protein n=1 Tax=Rhizophora mucronata TaxID=61149 RepID=A0A2P2N136_RHIMU
MGKHKFLYWYLILLKLFYREKVE